MLHLRLKWGIKTKYGTNHEVLSYEAMLIFKGYAQQQCVHFQETLPPVESFYMV